MKGHVTKIRSQALFLSFPEWLKAILGESMDRPRICFANSGDDV